MDWEQVRGEFPVTRNWAFFDHAAVAPLNRLAQKAFVDWAADLTENGVVNDPYWVNRSEEVRELAGKLIHADPLDVAFIKNTSEGIGFVAEGYPWRAGDNVVTAAEEYPSNLYPWMNLVERGVEVRTVASRDNRLHIDDIRSAMDSRTRVVSLSFVEFASGFRNDLVAIGSLCSERGIHFFVDAIQGLGVFPLDVQQVPVDFLAADSHKWLLGPQGAGIFYCRRELVDMLHAVGVGWNSVVGNRNFSRIDFRLKPHAGRWESGTLNFPGITAMGASMQLLLEIGIEQVRERVIALTDHLCEAASALGIQVFSSRLDADKSGIVSLIVPGADMKNLVKRCKEERIIVNLRAGRIRVSPHCYNTIQELDRLLEVLTHA